MGFSSWKDILDVLAIPLIIGFFALFWNSLQSLFKRRQFENLILRELGEISPFPKYKTKQTRWTEHITKKFIHQEIFKNSTDNRDFILNLQPDLVYFVKQLWTSIDNTHTDDMVQWLYYLHEIAKYSKCPDKLKYKIKKIIFFSKYESHIFCEIRKVWMLWISLQPYYNNNSDYYNKNNQYKLFKSWLELFYESKYNEIKRLEEKYKRYKELERINKIKNKNLINKIEERINKIYPLYLKFNLELLRKFMNDIKNNINDTQIKNQIEQISYNEIFKYIESCNHNLDNIDNSISKDLKKNHIQKINQGEEFTKFIESLNKIKELIENNKMDTKTKEKISDIIIIPNNHATNQIKKEDMYEMLVNQS